MSMAFLLSALFRGLFILAVGIAGVFAVCAMVISFDADAPLVWKILGRAGFVLCAALLLSTPPNPFKPSEFGHLPQHWYAHAMHALEIIGYAHPHGKTRQTAHEMYLKMVAALHLEPESAVQMYKRLTEDRLKTGTVTS